MMVVDSPARSFVDVAVKALRDSREPELRELNVVATTACVTVYGYVTSLRLAHVAEEELRPHLAGRILINCITICVSQAPGYPWFSYPAYTQLAAFREDRPIVEC